VLKTQQLRKAVCLYQGPIRRATRTRIRQNRLPPDRDTTSCASSGDSIAATVVPPEKPRCFAACNRGQTRETRKR